MVVQSSLLGNAFKYHPLKRQTGQPESLTSITSIKCQESSFPNVNMTDFSLLSFPVRLGKEKAMRKDRKQVLARFCVVPATYQANK